jgi:type I restriction enzyme S subunit
MEIMLATMQKMFPFAELVELQSDAGRKLKQKEYLTEGILPVVDQGAALIGGYTNDESLQYTGPLPVVVFGDHTRNFKLIDFPFAVGADGVKLLAPKDGVDASYLYYMLLAVELPNRGYSRHLQFLKKTELPLAPLPQQRRIVEAIELQLGRLDAAVARLQGAKARLKRYKQAVLKAAVEGRLTEEWREKNTLAPTSEELLAEILSEHQAIWETEQLETFKAKGKPPKDNGWKKKYQPPVPAELEALPSLPEGWNWVRIGTIGFVTKLAGFEYTEYVKYDPAGDLSVIKAENASRDGFRTTEFSKVKSETVAHLQRSKLIPGDILIVFVGSIGNVARVPDDQPYFLGPNIGMIRVKSKHVDPAYLEYFLRSPIGNHLINSFAKAVTQPSLSMGSIRLIPFAVPPIEEQRRIVDALEVMLEKQSEMETTLDAQLQQALRLRQAVLKRAFEGRLG